jgi:hypothetical protein
MPPTNLLAFWPLAQSNQAPLSVSICCHLGTLSPSLSMLNQLYNALHLNRKYILILWAKGRGHFFNLKKLCMLGKCSIRTTPKFWLF